MDGLTRYLIVDRFWPYNDGFQDVSYTEKEAYWSNK